MFKFRRKAKNTHAAEETKRSSVLGIELSTKEDDDQITLVDMTSTAHAVKTGAWATVLKHLQSRGGKNICKHQDRSGLNVLGLALGSGAPIYIIQLILDLYPDSVYCKDEYGMIPIHIACLSGTHSDIIRKIMDIDGGHSARIPDIDNRTALHYAVEYACLLCRKSDNNSSLMSYLHEQSIETVELILSAAPETVHFLTTRKDTPLDIPQLVKLSGDEAQDDFQLDEIYSLLQGTSVEIYRKQKKLWESNGFDTNYFDEANPGEATTHSEHNTLPSVLSSQFSSSLATSGHKNSTLDFRWEKLTLSEERK